ncbi:hypothetical protein C9890_0640 [Perkinsus sp. BL_2016]|nr:hypothetical protein C9890_0640 [Perkinsus sp. BL_2016]
MKYGCVYHNREQFVFEERRVSYRAGLWATLAGVTVGAVLSSTLILFQKITAILLFLTVVGYLVFRILYIALKSDPVGAIIFVLSMGGSLVLLYHLQETVAQLENSFHLMLFYTTVFGVLAPLTYLYAQVAFIEDKRKHQLIRVSSILCDTKTDETTTEFTDALFSDFLLWCKIIIQDFFRTLPLSGFQLFPALFELSHRRASYDSITPRLATEEHTSGVQVRNETLKRLKICFYHPWDYCCWIPIGGIGGPSVAFIAAGETRTVCPPFPGISMFKLKVFSPSLIDRELCFEPRSRRGDIFVVKDVQKRILTHSLLSPRVRSPKIKTPPPSRNSSSTSLRKNISFGSSHELTFLADFSGSQKSEDEESEINANEILVHNASSSEITVTFFRENAVSFLFPLKVEVEVKLSFVCARIMAHTSWTSVLSNSATHTP